MKVLKFGGTSLGSPERFQSVANLVATTNGTKIVVLSALSGTTNKLVQIGAMLRNKQTEPALARIDQLKFGYDEFISNLFHESNALNIAQDFIDQKFSMIRGFTSSPFGKSREKELLAQGEFLSTNLFHLCLNTIGISAHLISALDLIQLNRDGEPVVADIEKKLQEHILPDKNELIYVTQGFVCLNHEGDIDNLNRGGSDYSASLFGAAANAEEIQIWTDIDGLHNNDPRVVRNTYPIEHLSFDEAAELAYFGAKILHPASILPAQEKQIPVRLKNTMKPDAKGTLINDIDKVDGIKAVAAKEGITAIKIKSTRMLLAHGFLKQIFEVFEKFRTSIDMVTTSEIAVSLTIDDDTHLEAILSEVNRFGVVEVDRDQSIICVVGNNVMYEKGLTHKVLEALDEVPIRMISFGGSKNNISFLVKEEDKVPTLKKINQSLFRLHEIEEQ
jgi:aspartate kinase